MNNIVIPQRFRLMCNNLYKNYDCIVKYDTDIENKHFIGNKENRSCRFCNRNQRETKFRKEAHAISNLIGNNRLFSYYECDECNGVLFTQFESHFSNYMRLRHCVSQIHGKNGIPSYKNRVEDFSRIDIKDMISVAQKEDEDAIVNFDRERHIIHFSGKRTYKPSMVYKCLLKMALTIIPEEELPNVQNAMDYLMGRKKYMCKLPVLYRQYGGIHPFGKPICFLYKRKEKRIKENVPQYLFMIAYGNFVFQLYIPFCDNDKFLQGKDCNFIFIPTPEDITQIPIKELLDLSSDDRVEKEEYGIDFSFGSYEKKDLTININDK